MNVTLTLSKDNKAMVLYDRPLGFAPSWVECSADGRGLRIIADDGREVRVGIFFPEISCKLADISDVLLVRMEQNKAVDGVLVPFVSQNYEDGEKRLMANTPDVSEEYEERVESQKLTDLFQGNNWHMAHNTSLSMPTRLLNLSAEREGELAASGGRRGINGAVPVQVQKTDGQVLAMQNSQLGAGAQQMQTAMVRRAPEQLETEGKVDLAMIELQEEIERRTPVEGYTAQGSVRAGQGMAAAVTTGFISVMPGGPESMEGFSEGPQPPQPVNRGPGFNA